MRSKQVEVYRILIFPRKATQFFSEYKKTFEKGFLNNAPLTSLAGFCRADDGRRRRF